MPKKNKMAKEPGAGQAKKLPAAKKGPAAFSTSAAVAAAKAPIRSVGKRKAADPFCGVAGLSLSAAERASLADVLANGTISVVVVVSSCLVNMVLVVVDMVDGSIWCLYGRYGCHVW